MTEVVSRRFGDFDLWSTRDAVESMYEGQLLAMAAVQPALDEIALAADAAAARLGTQGRLVYAGAGTSGRLAVQDGAELGPTFGWPQQRAVFCMAGGMQALTISMEGAEDNLEAGRAQIQQSSIGRDDVVIGVAASGKTPFVLGALGEANARGALTIGISNNRGTPIFDVSTHAILAETGSEIIAGSTRMKAGTAQKAILTILSTAIMTRLGRVYKGFMVDMIISNKKLNDRAVSIVSVISGCSEKDAESCLTQASQNIKIAILMAFGETTSGAERLLENARGNLRRAMAKGNY